MNEDDITRRINRDDEQAPAENSTTRTTGPIRTSARPPGVDDDDSKTRVYGATTATNVNPTPGQTPDNSDQTTVWIPETNESDNTARVNPGPPPQRNDGPVVGWIVVIDGPGKGASLNLTYGMNRMGRGNDQKLALNYGDSEISRDHHASVTYDAKGKKFYVNHGGGQNLTYLDDEPLLQPTEVKGGETIGIGKTLLKFVPLCGPEFDWDKE